MSVFRFFLIFSVLAILIVTSLAVLPGTAQAANSLPIHAPHNRIIDPCWRCLFATPATRDESEGFVYTGKSIESHYNELAAKTSTPPCILVETKGPGGICAIACWPPTSK